MADARVSRPGPPGPVGPPGSDADATALVAAEATTRGGVDTALDTRLDSVESSHYVGTLAGRPAANTPGIKTAYCTDDNGGTLYVSDGAAWTIAGQRGLELAFAEVLSNTAGIAAGFIDITGASVTFTGRGRPVRIDAWCPLNNQLTATGTIDLFLTDGANVAVQRIDRREAIPAGGFVTMGGFLRLPTVDGVAYTYKLRAATSAGTLTVMGAVGRPIQLMVTEV